MRLRVAVPSTRGSANASQRLLPAASGPLLTNPCPHSCAFLLCPSLTGLATKSTFLFFLPAARRGSRTSRAMASPEFGRGQAFHCSTPNHVSLCPTVSATWVPSQTAAQPAAAARVRTRPCCPQSVNPGEWHLLTWLSAPLAPPTHTGQEMALPTSKEQVPTREPWLQECTFDSRSRGPASWSVGSEAQPAITMSDMSRASLSFVRLKLCCHWGRVS